MYFYFEVLCPSLFTTLTFLFYLVSCQCHPLSYEKKFIHRLFHLLLHIFISSGFLVIVDSVGSTTNISWEDHSRLTCKSLRYLISGSIWYKSRYFVWRYSTFLNFIMFCIKVCCNKSLICRVYPVSCGTEFLFCKSYITFIFGLYTLNTRRYFLI